MPPEAPARAPALDLSRRADPRELPELMDEPCSFDDLRACLRDLAQVNRLTGAFRPTLHFLERAALRSGGQTLRILDVGSGYGDILRRVYRWALRRGVPVHLTGVDLNPHATRAAREATTAAGLPPSAIHWTTGDAFDLPGLGEVDLVISSLLTHHLPDTGIIHLLRWMETRARLGWFVNDLERRPIPLHLFGLLAQLLRWHPFVRHDGPVSFRRAFLHPDWIRLLAAAGIPPDAAHIAPAFPARLCVERLR